MMPAVSARVDLATPAEPGTTRARLKAAALGVVVALLVPLPAAAAPAPCDHALRYAAQSGAGLIRIHSLDLGPAGRTDKSVNNVRAGEVKSAFVARSAVNAAALGRVLDGGPANREEFAEVLRQTAPPTHQEPERREHEATGAGPFELGASKLSVHSRWEPGLGCGSAVGEATRAEVGLRRGGVLVDDDAALVRVPGKISGLSTTAMERRGPAARAVAAASMAAGELELLDGAVRVKIVKPPSLLATMSGTDGGEIRYQPAVLKVSGDGLETARLDTAGDSVELKLDEAGSGNADQGTAGRAAALESGPSEGARNDNDRKPGAVGGKPDDDGAGAGLAGQGGLFDRLPEVGMLDSGAPLPSIPGVPQLPAFGDEQSPEAAPAAGPGTTVRITLGDVRQAVSGHVIAAKATAMTIGITKGPDSHGYGDSAPDRTGAVLNLDVGLLEAAAAAPEPAGGASSVAGASGGGGGGGLPITGPRADVPALTGLALLLGGAAALIFGMRGRFRP